VLTSIVDCDWAGQSSNVRASAGEQLALEELEHSSGSHRRVSRNCKPGNDVGSGVIEWKGLDAVEVPESIGTLYGDIAFGACLLMPGGGDKASTLKSFETIGGMTNFGSIKIIRAEIDDRILKGRRSNAYRVSWYS